MTQVIEPRPLLRAQHVSFHYAPRRGISDINLDLWPGQITALAGENGTGKSTLVRCLTGDLSPEMGVVTIDGRPVASEPATVDRQGVSVVWQDLALCDNLDVAANLLLGDERSGIFLRDAPQHRKAARLLDRLGVPFGAPTNRRVGELSRGQKQLLAVARALRGAPKVLVLDEPTANLAIGWADQVEELADRLRRQGTSILLVTHDLDQMFRLADRIVVMHQGTIRAEVDPSDSHPDDIVALMRGQEPATSARHQLDRLQTLSDQLTTADPDQGLRLILEVMSRAFPTSGVAVHQSDQRAGVLRLVASTGLDALTDAAWQMLDSDATDNPLVRSIAVPGALSVEPVPSVDSGVWSATLADQPVQQVWCIPVRHDPDAPGVITMLMLHDQPPTALERDLVVLYADYVIGAMERAGAIRAQNEAAALRRSQELQRDFLSRLSHELRTPLTAIRGYASSLLQTDVTWDAESEARFLTRIAGESARLGRLVDDLLDFSAIEAELLRLNPDWCDLELILEAAVACVPQTTDRPIAVRCDPDIPPVWADHDRLEQVLVNLIDNSVRHTPPGTSVTVEARPVESAMVELTVADSGGGPPEYVLRNPFQVGRERRSSTAGAGLGLSIAKGMVDAHGGTIELENQGGKGTLWRIRIPIESTAAAVEHGR
ncbi:ATP-binding cassette domain-containing protein [Rudaeicoccus suwonensis]|uniref:histidine kinase n=1 Tax=Rudaeicoccus suwonensis TaxID=657409 RepID=A0A561EAH6_9MICO|nr:ATP-binding cassette domain-containing protein [Rudaeicoccus suwonensis]TWE12611.1 histidine kinase/DNA gyrase B/HSP90-like ATPase [Rudaeicoccus suwonensis]